MTKQEEAIFAYDESDLAFEDELENCREVLDSYSDVKETQ